MKTSSLIAGLTIATLGFSSLTHAVNLPPPTGATSSNTGGIFMSYFQNLANNDCTSSEIVQGFLNGTTEATFLKPDCKSVGSLLGAFFGGLGATDTSKGPIAGFNATTGAPLYYTFGEVDAAGNAIINNIRNRVFSGVVLTGTSTINGPTYMSGDTYIDRLCMAGSCTSNVSSLVSSQWKDITGGIGYTGGIVGIGVSPLFTTLSYNSTQTRSEIVDPLGKIFIGFNNSNAGVHIMNNSGNPGIPGYGDLFARNIQAYGNLSVSGTTNLGGNVNIGGNLTVNGTGSFANICLAGSCINNFSSLGGSKWTDIAGGAIQRSSNVTVVGNITANGFLYSSDRNLKKNIAPLEGSLEKIMKLNGYSYNWKSTGKADMGVIAQEVETVYPDLVHTNAEGVKSVEYANLIAPLIEAVKTQQKEIESLKAEVASLKK